MRFTHWGVAPIPSALTRTHTSFRLPLLYPSNMIIRPEKGSICALSKLALTAGGPPIGVSWVHICARSSLAANVRTKNAATAMLIV